MCHVTARKDLEHTYYHKVKAGKYIFGDLLMQKFNTVSLKEIKSI